MTSAVARELKITYGTFVVGGTTEREITGPIVIAESYEALALSFDVLVRADTEALFQDAVEAFVAAFKARDLLIKVEYGSETHVSLDPSTNSGFNTRASCTKRGEPAADTGRSRLYNVSLAGSYPATDLGGRRDSRTTVSVDESGRMTITYSGTWTAIAGSSASAAYLANGPTWVGAQNTALASGRTMERKEYRYEPDRNNKELTFTEVWTQLIKNQAAGTLDHASIVNHTIQMRIDKPAPGDSGRGIVRLREVTVQFGCGVLYSATQDLDALWADTILPYLDSLVEEEWGPDQIARVDEDASFDATSNRITAVVHYSLAIGSTDVIESRVTSGYEEQSGLDFTPPWDEDPLAAYVDEGPAVKLRVTQRTVKTLGGASAKSRLGGGGSTVGVTFTQPDGTPSAGTGAGGLQPEEGGGGAQASGWNLVSNRSMATTLWIGPEEKGFAIGILEETVVERYVTKPGGGGGGQGGLRPGPGGSLTGFMGPRR